MTRLHAPAGGRRAALLTLGAVGIAVLAATFLLAGWQDALYVAAFNHSWTALTTAQLLGTAARWAASVTLWCAVCWVAVVASRRAARRWVVAAAAGVVLAWTALGVPSAVTRADGSSGWYDELGTMSALLPWWPGPVAPTYSIPPPGWENVPDPMVVGPGVLMPVVLLAAVVVTCLVASRQPHWPVRALVAGRAWVLAALALGLPALSFAALSLYATISTDDGGSVRDSLTYALHDPGTGLLVAMVTAALLVGRMPGGTLVAVLVGLSATVPRAWDWSNGGGDYLLATSAAGAVAIAVAACVGPTAAALTRLEDRSTVADYRLTTTSVPEGSDADDRARA